MRHFVLLTTLFSSLAMGQIESVIQFNGQNADTVKIEQSITVNREVEVEVPSTCTRQVPYEVYECNDVTRYRQECSWVPARNECWDEPERVCRTVTRTRQECSNGPSRRVCTDNPPRQVCTSKPDRQECSTVTRHREECSTGSSREVCHDTPSREVCTDRPSREVCRTKPDGSQHCTQVGGGRTCNRVGGGRQCRTVPGERSCRQVPYQDRECRTVSGGQTCTTVGGGQSCHDVEGPRVCRDVPYTDQDCDTVSRRRCREVPGHNACNDIPYTEQVCGNVTRYNTESYACTRTETVNQPVVKLLKGEIDVNFVTNGLVEEFPLAVILSQVSADVQEYTVKTALKKEPNLLVISREGKVEAKEGESEITLDGSVTVELLEPKMVAPAFPEAFTSATLKENNQALTLTFKGQISALGSVEVTVLRKGIFGRRKVVGEAKFDYPSPKAKLEGDKLILDLRGEIDSKLSKLLVDVKLKATPNVNGEILNAKKPGSEKEFDTISVKVE